MQPEGRIVDQHEDTGIASKKEKLERRLRLSIKEADNVSTSSSPRCPKVLKAINVFLTQWDALEEEEMDMQQEDDERGSKQARNLPSDYLRIVFCHMLSNLNPVENVDKVREQILSTLRSLQTPACRQVLLDFLPALTRIFVGNGNPASIWGEGKSKQAKKQILSCLREVFENDPNSLRQILQFFSSIFSEESPEKHVIFRRDVFLFVIEIFPKVPEPSLHIAVRALVQYVDNTEDARLAVDSVRTELSLLEKTYISDMASVATTFDEVVRGTEKNEELFVEEYIVVLEELVHERKTKFDRPGYGDVHPVRDVEKQLLTFDLVMMMNLSDSIVYHDRVLRMTLDGSLLSSDLLSDEHVSRLVELVNDERTCIDETTKRLVEFESNPRLRLLESLVNFSMSILLVPLHSSIGFDVEKFFPKVQGLLIRIILKLPKDFQTEAISTALKILDHLMKGSKTAITDNASKSRLEGKANARTKICLNIFVLLLSLVSRRRKILTPFRNHLVAYISSDSFDCLQNNDLLQTLCNVVTKIPCNKNSNGALDCIMICRTLLFSPPMVDTATPPQEQDEFICRQIRGMVFANAIISYYDLDTTMLVTVQKMVSRILLSPHSNVLSLDPRIGMHGMKLLRTLREQIKCDHSLGKDIFQVASLVLAHSRIVYYPDPEQSKRSNLIFAYNEVPSFFPFDDQTTKQCRFRKMTFRFNSFSNNETLLIQPSSWERFSLWIFQLIHTYLALGRTSKWNPRAWIFAGFELPSISSSTVIAARRKENLLNWMKSCFSSFGSSQNDVTATSRTVKRLLELIKGARTVSEKEEIVDSTYRFTLTLLFALSLSIAVLSNAYNHFKDLLEQGCDKTECDKKNEALQMIHYQFTKIYKIKEICQSMEHLFRNLGSRSQNGAQRRSKKRRLSRSSPASQTMKIQIKAETAAHHLRESLTRLLYPMDFIPKKVFWICLTDRSHDKLIISAVKNLQHTETVEPILEVVQLRLNLIMHLSKITQVTPVRQNGIQAIFKEGTAMGQQDIVRCLCLTSFLLQSIPLLKKRVESNELVGSLIKLTSEYLRLVCAILISKMDFDQSFETNKRDIRIFGLYLSILGSKQPLNYTYKSVTISDSFTVKDFNTLVSSFKDHIGDHHTSITSQLLETMSIFAARSGSSILECMINVNWDATFLSKYSNGANHEDVSGSPFVLVKLLNSLSRNNPHGHINTTTEECCFHQTITKLMKHRYKKSLERHQYLAHSMCRHWGLLALSPRRMKLISNYLNTLLGKLVEYLRNVDDCLDGQKADLKDSEESSDEEDGEYLPPSNSAPLLHKPSIPTFSNLASLTSYSYPVYFDMLMRMTVSSISLFSIPEEMLGFKDTATTSHRLHPVQELERMVFVYGSLVKLYKDKFHIFPKCLQSSITNISKCMLDVSVAKSKEYIEWRNCQPVLHVKEGNFKGFDLASTTFLKKLLDAFGLHVIGTLRMLCVHSGSAVIHRAKKVQVKKSNQSFVGIPGLRSLARKTERTFEFLSKTSDQYNTGEIKSDNLEAHGSKREHEASTKDSGLQPEESSMMEDLLERGVEQESQNETNKTNLSSTRKRGSHNSSLTLSSGDYNPSSLEDEENFIDEDDESSSSISDGFGVSGDWGQHVEDSDSDEYDSEFVINQFQKSS